MRRGFRTVLQAGFLILLAMPVASANQDDITVPRDKNSSATIFDVREAKAREVLKDMRISGADYAQVEQINIILDTGRVLAGWDLGDVTFVHIDPNLFPQSVTLANVIAWHGKPDQIKTFAATENAGPAKSAGAWGSVYLAFDGNSRLVGLGLPVAWAIKGTRFSGVGGGPVEDLMTFLRKGEPKSLPALKPDPSGILPSFSTGILELAGGSLSIENPGDKTVVVGIRSGFRGKDLVVKPGASVRQSLPSGKYDIYFLTDGDPHELLQGDSLFVDATDVTIKFGKTGEGNYDIWKIKSLRPIGLVR